MKFRVKNHPKELSTGVAEEIKIKNDQNDILKRSLKKFGLKLIKMNFKRGR